jgi:dihydroorotate dehydrogenase (fumarate)
MADLTTRCMGIDLAHPIVPSASPLSKTLDDIKRLEDAGAAAIVIYSLFEEQIALETGEFSQVLLNGPLGIAEGSLYFPRKFEYERDPEGYVEHIRRAKEAVDIPIIGSLNGTSVGGWPDYAGKISQAGADGLEINVYFVPNSDTFFGVDIETLYLDILSAVKSRVELPVAVRLSPFFTSLPNFATRLDEAGADALVLFNRFYQPDVDVEAMEVYPTLALSRSADILLPLRRTAILSGQLDCSLALSTGVHNQHDVPKAILAGVDVANVCLLLLREGIEKLRDLIRETSVPMEKLGLESVSDAKGSMSLERYVEPTAFERASYIRILQSFGSI